MPDIHIERPTKLTAEEAIRAIETQVLAHPQLGLFVESHEVKGSVVTLSGSRGVSGRFEAREGLVIVDVQLSGMAAMMQPMVEAKIKEALERLFPG